MAWVSFLAFKGIRLCEVVGWGEFRLTLNFRVREIA